jgi:putative ABC transport system permease protein
MMEPLLRDLRFAVRSLARNPGFTIVSVLTLALGIGATTAVFSVVYGVLLRPLPFPGADRLVQIVQVMEERATGGTYRSGLAPDQFLNLQEHATTLQSVGVFAHAPRTLIGGAIPARLNGAGVLPGLFEGVGARALRGRTLRPQDGDPDAEPVVVLSYRTWRTHFGGREDIVGTHVTLDDVQTRVVGVMPDSFTFPSMATASMTRNSAGEIEDAPEFWITAGRFRRLGQRDSFSMIQGYAVVKPGVSYERALAEIRSLIGPLPDGRVRPVELVNARVEMARRTSRALAIFQLGMVLVLLIACVNVVNLLLTRAAGRRRELAVRMALGATRGRLVREGVAEAVVLSIGGGALGCLLAYGLTGALRTLPPHIFPRLRDIQVDGIVLAFALALSVATGLIVGLLAALRVARASVVSQLRPQAPYSLAVPGARLRPSSVLVIAEIAAAVVLLTGGGLLVNSFVRFVSVDLGYDPRDVVSLQVSLPKDRYGSSQAHEQFYREAAGALRALPGVETVAAADYDVTGSPIGFYALTIDGQAVASSENDITYRRASPDYFKTLGIRVIEGREFRDEDWSPVARKVIVNESFARRHFPGATAIGHRLRWSEWKDLEIIGVVADSREQADGEIRRAFYLPIDTGGFGAASMVLFLRSTSEPAAILAAARGVLARIDPQLAPYNAASLEEVMAHSAASPRLYGFVSLWCAVVALALAAIGLYGVLSYSVGSRTHEFGIRIALGADARMVRWQVLRLGLILTLSGLAIGLGGSYGAAQALSSLLFGITPGDLTTFAIAASLLLMTAIAACLVPSIRATRVDPVVALRAE